MIKIIAIVILLSSIVGMAVIFWRKIPVLTEITEETSNEFSLKNNFLKLKKRINFLNPFKYFFSRIFLQKILSKTRILTLRLESKIAYWLQKLREKSLKKKTEENDNYWGKVKNQQKDKDESAPM